MTELVIYEFCKMLLLSRFFVLFVTFVVEKNIVAEMMVQYALFIAPYGWWSLSLPPIMYIINVHYGFCYAAS